MPVPDQANHVLVIADPDAKLRTAVREQLSGTCRVFEATSIKEVSSLFSRSPIQILLTRDVLDDGSGTDLCAQIEAISPQTIRLMYGETPTALQALGVINNGHVWRYFTGGGYEDILPLAVQEALQNHHPTTGFNEELQSLRTTKEMLELKVEQRTREIVALNEEVRAILDKMQSLTMVDELTGFWNRRVMQNRLESEFRTAGRYHSTLSCMMLGIQQFQHVHTDYGFQMGDALLQEFAGRVQHQMREVDIICCIGGSDFLIILPHTNGSQALIAAQRLHRRLTSEPYRINDQVIELSVHIGVAEMQPSTTSSVELLRLAEVARDVARESHDIDPIVLYNPAIDLP